MLKFEEMEIYQIVELAKNNHRGAHRYIVDKYKGLIYGTIRKRNYYLRGGDRDDLFQEGLIGLYKAIRDFNPDNGKFDVFSQICIERQLISAIKTATRKKHTPLNDMISLDRSLPENDNLSMMDIFGAKEEVLYSIDFECLNPEEQLILNETREIQEYLLDEALSDKEKAVYSLYLENKSYKEIMVDLNVDNPKMIDNAIQRVKRKIEKIKNNELIQTRKRM